jgi:CHAT domain-containing protein
LSKTRVATRPFSVAAILVLLSLSAQGAGQQSRRLQLGESIDASIAPGGQHTYELALEAGEFAAVTVQQRGVDVAIQLRGADGSAVARFQNELRRTGEERATVVAGGAGTYTLEVTPGVPGLPGGDYTIRFAERRPATDADRSMQEVEGLRLSADRLSDAGKPDEALAVLNRAMATTERIKGRDDLMAGLIARSLGAIDIDRRDFRGAEAQYQRAQSVLERIVSPDDPIILSVSASMAIVYERTERRAEGEKLVRRALEALERMLGPDHPQVGHALLTLANIREDAGDHDEAERLDRRAVSIFEATEGTDSLMFAILLNNLGNTYLNKKQYPQAEPYFLRSLAIIEKIEGADSLRVAIALQNLGVAARNRRDYARAEEYYLRALAIRQKALPADHPDIASNLNNLAILYNLHGDVPRALETHFRALEIWENATGPYSGGTLTSLGNIARTYAGAGDVTRALAYQQRADAVLEMQLVLNLAVGSERQKLAFVDSVTERTDRTISLNLDAAPANPQASALAALVLLQRKGRVLDAMTDTLGTLRQRAGEPEDRGLLDQLSATTAQLARVALNSAAAMTGAARRAAIKDLETKKETLEAAISEHSAEFRAVARPVTLAAVQAAIPTDAVLIEFAVFRPFDPKAEAASDWYGPPHYAAYVIGHEAAPHGVDLGVAAPIDASIDAWRQALRDPTRTDAVHLGRAVDQRVLQPLVAWLGDASRLLVSPDGDLNLVPFEALVGPDRRYRIERHAITYLTSGRDLLRMQVPRDSRREPLVIADPFFGEPAEGPAASKRGALTPPLYFSPLAATAEEGRMIKGLFPGATVLTGPRASKDALTRAGAPSILHIASHGFFLTDSATIQNPLLRSGLALAGANLSPGATGGGILTALEASNLNLWGTRLVTLSACDTGVGQVRNREGVYGLRRAFFLAGAESLVMSLWPVSDYVTRQVMTAYYGGLKKGLGRGDALRQAQLALIHQPNRHHPFFWAGFIQAGEWGSLDGRR